MSTLWLATRREGVSEAAYAPKGRCLALSSPVFGSENATRLKGDVRRNGDPVPSPNDCFVPNLQKPNCPMTIGLLGSVVFFEKGD